jgi:Flp pilus assembly protein TadD
MATLKIDSKEYDLENLSRESKAQLASIQFVEQELMRLVAKSNALQTAKTAYLRALKSALLLAGKSDTDSPRNLTNPNQIKSPPQIKLNSLLENYKNGRYEIAQHLATNLTQQYPKHPLGWKVLGSLFKQTGRFQDSLTANQKVLEISPNDAEAHSNVGNTLRELGMLEDAETSCKKAIGIMPALAEAHINLGSTLQKMGRLKDAETSFKKAIAIKPYYAEAHYNLGVTLQELGRLKSAVTSYNKAIAIKPDYEEAHTNLGITLQELGRLEDAETSYNKAIAIKSDYAEALLNKAKLSICQNQIIDAIKSLEKVIKINNDDTSLVAAVTLAVLYFQEDDLYSAQQQIENSKDILQSKNQSVQNDKNYHSLLNNIISWNNINVHPLNNHIAEMIYVIGESNALVSNRLFIRHLKGGFLCKVQWIVGCKQWHLGNSSPNKYKEQFERVLSALPYKSTVLLSIGEIDCRVDDGILKHIKNHPSKILSELIKSTIQNYLMYVYKITSIYSNHVVIQGVPCPNVDPTRVGSNDMSILVDLIKEFNYELCVKSKKIGFEFLDLHTLTDRGDGFSNVIWHIDEYHLSPAGMLEAWKRHLEFVPSEITAKQT